MRVLGSLAAILLIAGAMNACAAGDGESGPTEEAPAEEPLDFTVDAVDVAHGALRFGATMVDGGADVSVRLGGDCEPREVGGGLSTLTSLVWSLADADVAAAIGCGLVVRARVRDGTHRVNKTADIEVAIDVSAEEGQNADDGPQLQSVSPSTTGVGLAFTQVTPSARLTTGDSILQVSHPASEDDDAAASDGAGAFTVPRLDFARSVLRESPFHVDGASFVTSMSVGGVVVSRESSAPDETVELVEGTTEETIEETTE